MICKPRTLVYAILLVALVGVVSGILWHSRTFTNKAEAVEAAEDLSDLNAGQKMAREHGWDSKDVEIYEVLGHGWRKVVILKRNYLWNKSLNALVPQPDQ